MGLVRLSGPPELPVSLAELRAHLRIADDQTNEDALIVAYCRAVFDHLDGKDGVLGRCLTSQQWQLTLDAFPVVIVLPLPPLQSVDAITYVDPAGAEQTLDPALYQVTGIGGVGRIVPAYGERWPSTRRQAESVAVTYTAGYGSFADVPENVRGAMLLATADLFDHRGAIQPTNQHVTDAVDRLLFNHRVLL